MGTNLEDRDVNEQVENKMLIIRATNSGGEEILVYVTILLEGKYILASYQVERKKKQKLPKLHC